MGKVHEKKPFADRDFPPDSTHIAEDDDGKKLRGETFLIFYEISS